MKATSIRRGRQQRLFALTTLFAVSVLTLGTTSGSRAQTVDFSKAFLPPVIGPGSVSTLQFTVSVDGSSGRGIENVAFIDVLPAGMTIADPSRSTTTCVNGLIDAPSGGTTISFRNARVGAGVSCLVSVDVTASMEATYANTSGLLTSDGGSFGTATATLSVSGDRPGFTKTFSPSTVSLGGRSRLTLKVDNGISGADLTAISFTDDLPPGMTIAGPANASTTCQHPQIPATLDAAPGSSVIALSFFGAASFAAPSVCEVVVDVVAGAVGDLGNTTGELTTTVANVQQSSGRAAATLTVLSSPIAFTKTFRDDPVRSGGTVDLDFSITNLSRSEVATVIAFADDLNAVLDGLSSISGSQVDVCGPGSVLSGESAVELFGGSLGPGEACLFSVTLQVPAGAAPGIYPSTTGSITALIGGSPTIGQPATDNLFVSTPGPVLTKAFSDEPVSPGATATITFSIENANTVSALSDIAFVDELTTFTAFPVSATLPQDGFCGAGSSMSMLGLGIDRQGVSMVGGSLPAGESCTFDVLVDIPNDTPSGTYVNVTEPITGLIGAEEVEGGPARDTLTVVAPPALSKVFLTPSVSRGQSVTLEFTLTHGGEAAAAAEWIAFTDNLTTAFAGLIATDTPLSDVCGPGSQLTGTTLLSLSGGTLGVGEACSFRVNLAVPADAPYGSHTNRTGILTATIGGTNVVGNVAEAGLTVTPLELTKKFTDDPILPGGLVSLQFSITNRSATDDATGLFFSDNLTAALAGLLNATQAQSDICGPGSSLSGTSLLNLTGGSLASGASCSFTTQLSIPPTAAPGSYINVTSELLATVGGVPLVSPGASDVLVVADTTSALVIAKEFTDDPVSPGGQVTLSFTIGNAGTNEISGIHFTDDLESVLPGLTAIELPMNNVCGDGSQVTGTSLLTLTGGTLPSGASCTIEVRLVVPEGVQGSYRNTTGLVRGRVGGVEPISGAPASDDLVVEAGEGRSGSIGNFIWYDDDGDGLQNEASSSGLVGVTVHLLTGACPGSPEGSTTTSNDGAYEFTELEPGDYCVDVDEGSITLPIPQATAVLTTGNEPLTVTLSSGEKFDDADFGYDTLPVATEHTSDVPRDYDLHTNYPNPFNPTTIISYDLPEAAAVSLTVVDLVGRTVRELASGMKPAGTYEVSFDATTLPSGVYFYRLEAGDYVETRPMVVVR